MAEGKKSFIAYCDWKTVFDSLPDEYAGKLVKHLFCYVNDEDPESDDIVINASFALIKNQLKRDLQEYREKCKVNSENGKKGGRPKKTETNPNKPNGFSKNPTKAKKADNDNDTDNDIESRKKEFRKLLTPYEEKYGESFIEDFFGHWSQHGIRDKKMKFEKQDSFGISRRLATWKRNEEKFNPNSQNNTEVDPWANKKRI